jgi:cation transport regulator ChaB
LRYDIAEDLAVETELVEIPFVYRYNLPEAAQRVFRSVYNAELRQHGSRRNDGLARQRAIAAVKECFVRDDLGTWRPKEVVETARPLPPPSR